MPSITQDKLKALESAAEDAQRRASAAERTVLRKDELIREFDDTLSKIRAAARGQPISSSRGEYGGGFANVGFEPDRPLDPCRKIKRQERLEAEVRHLHDEVTMLRSRLAAVDALASFAMA